MTPAITIKTRYRPVGLALLSARPIMSAQIRDVARVPPGVGPSVATLMKETSSAPHSNGGEVANDVIRRRALNVGHEQSTVDRMFLRHDDDMAAVAGGLQPGADPA